MLQWKGLDLLISRGCLYWCFEDDKHQKQCETYSSDKVDDKCKWGL